MEWYERLAAALQRARDLETDEVIHITRPDGHVITYRVLRDENGVECVAVRHGGVIPLEGVLESYRRQLPGCVIHRERTLRNPITESDEKLLKEAKIKW